MNSGNNSAMSGSHDDISRPLKESSVDENNLLVDAGEKSFRLTNFRWLALVFACFLMVGNYMSYDFPTYLQTPIGQEVFGCEPIDEDAPGFDPKAPKTPECLQYGKYYPWLYSIYSFPNFILPLFGGFFIDKIGIRIGLIIFTGIIALGQLFCALSGWFAGGYQDNTTVFVFLYIGRFIFALGGENQSVTQSSIVSKWFVGKELAFALGTNISCARLGSVAGGFILPEIYDKAGNLTAPLMFAEGICLMSFCFMLGLVYMDKRADKQEGKDEEEKLDPEEEVNLKDIKEFPFLYWLLTLSCLCNYIGIFIFLQFGTKYLQYNFQDSVKSSGKWVTMPYLISACLAPFIGFLSDKLGQRQWLLLFSSCIMCLSHVLWLVLPNCPAGEEKCSVAWQIIPLVCMGIFYSFYAAILWPCIPLVLKPNMVGTGFGVATSIQNFGLAVAPLLVQYIMDNTTKGGGFFWSEVFFVMMGIICILISFAIIIVNAKTGNKLGKISGGKKSRASMAHSFR